VLAAILKKKKDMKTYEVTYKLNGVVDTYFVSQSETNLSFELTKFSIIHTTKTNLLVKNDDDFEIINIQEYN